MPWVHRLLYTLRTLADEPPSSGRKDKPSERKSVKHRQAAALVITFRDLFTSGGLNLLLEDMESSRKAKSHNSAECTSKTEALVSLSPHKVEICKDLRVALERPLATSDDLFADPLSQDERILASSSVMPTRSPSRLLVPAGGRRHAHLTVPLSAEDENETVNALRKALKWSPRKQKLAKFAVPLPKEEEHKAVAVVQNAVNIVKEEQERKKKQKFKLTFC